MKMSKLMGMLFASIMASVSAIEYNPKTVDEQRIPSVTIDVVTSGGRQKIVGELFDRHETTLLDLVGDSVVGQHQSYWLGMSELADRGYTQRGSFAQYTRAISGVPFHGSVVPTPQGWYHAEVKLRLDDERGRTCLEGTSWITMYDGRDGNLVVHEDPMVYIWLPKYIAVEFPVNVTAARWFHPKGGYIDLSYWQDRAGRSRVIVSEEMVDEGMLVVAYERPSDDAPGAVRTAVRGYDLSNGQVVEGQDFAVRLGVGQFINVLTVSSFDQIARHDQMFFQDWDYLYGRFPLIELTLERTTTGRIAINVPVWGAEREVSPNRVVIEPKVTQPPLTGQPFEVELDRDITLPAGIYRIRSTFDGLLDVAFLEGKG